MENEHGPRMVNEANLFRSVVKRLFTGKMHEILIELLQNSQRAGATHVDIHFPRRTRCVISDNGHGLLDGIHGLRNMLVLADSFYEDSAVQQNQEPMGIGLYSLIAKEQVKAICIESNEMQLLIRTKRWLEDYSYLTAWEMRVRSLPVQQEGFRLTIVGTAGLMEELRSCLLKIAYVSPYRKFPDVIESMSPVCGYEDLLEIFLDHQRISSRIPSVLELPQAQIIDLYQGNEVRISVFCPCDAGVCVNWYGQILAHRRPALGFQAYLIVRSGQPVHPQAPTRRGLIEDQALEAFYGWCQDRIFAWIQTQEMVNVSVVQRFYVINRERAERECPFAIIQEWKPLPKTYYCHSYNTYTHKHRETGSSDMLGPKQVVCKATLSDVILLDEEVVVPTATKDSDEVELETYQLGLPSLLRATGLTAYYPGVGAEATHVFVWMPGEKVDNYHTTTLGNWGIGRQKTVFHTDKEKEIEVDLPETWRELSEAWVFVADRTDFDEITAINWVIGLSSTEEMIPFLEVYGHIAHEDYASESDEDKNLYDDSVADLIRTYRPKQVKHTYVDAIDHRTYGMFLPEAIQQHLPDGYDAYAAQWTFVSNCSEQEQQNGKQRSVQYLLLIFSDGFQKKITFYIPED